MTKRDTSKEPTKWKMQELILKQTGRKRQYDELIESKLEATGLPLREVKVMVLDMMGLGETGHVIREYRKILDRISLLEKEEENLRDLETDRAVSRQSEFERCFSKLPSNAARTVEFKWIENHPAMVIRKSVGGNPIEICLEDILDAPSKSAVGQLKHWVNRKDEFYKNLMVAAGKKAGTKEGEEAAKAEKDRQDDSIDDIKEMLGRISGGP